ncbi:hypothetical protein L9F63_003894, partial [Diploptera punctata]
LALVLYQKKGSTWRKTIYEATENICTLVKNDKDFWPLIQKASNMSRYCPLKKGYYVVRDAVLKINSVPPVISKGCYRITISILTPKNEAVARVHLYGTVSKADASDLPTCNF